MEKYIVQFLNSLFPEDISSSLYIPTAIFAVAAIAIISYYIGKRIITPIIRRIILHTKNDWDDDIFNPKVLKAFCILIPALIISYLLPSTLGRGGNFELWISKATDIYILWAIIHLINIILQSFFDTLDSRNSGKVHTLRGVLQMVKLFFIIIGLIIALSIIIGKSPIAIIAAFGASAAVLMLIFQDAILGVVAGVQLTVNEMLKKGDWIIVPKADANGEVIEISLTTVKVRNWDNSITTVPPYTLIKDSFQNLKPMQESGGRRVSRSICIDINSIRFLNDSELDALRENGLINADITDPHPVNLRLLSRHIENYLATNPNVNTSMLFMVRQLQPTPQGVPLELYFFVNDTQWKNYEHIQAEVFDYMYATVPLFHLSIYQAPSSSDFRSADAFTKNSAERE